MKLSLLLRFRAELRAAPAPSADDVDPDEDLYDPRAVRLVAVPTSPREEITP